MKTTIFIFVSVLLLLGISIPTQAGSVPQLINYQGRLTDQNGNAMTGSKKIEINLYDAVSGGNKVWGPQVFDNVPLEDGHFNVILGPSDSQDRAITDSFNTENCFIGIKVGNTGTDLTNVTEITPRQQILSTPYAIRSEYAEKATSMKISCVTVRGTGQKAYCPEGYIVTGCSAGMNKGSVYHYDTYCDTGQPDTDWTQARCCKIE